MRALSMLLLFAALAAQAEVFKCTDRMGRTVYQEKPCETAVKSQQLDIKSDPEQEAKAKARLKVLEAENDARREERRQTEKEAAEQRNQLERLNALKSSAWAQQQQADAQRRQADVLERQNQQPSNPFWVVPAYTPYLRRPGDNDIERLRDKTSRTPKSDDVKR